MKASANFKVVSDSGQITCNNLMVCYVNYCGPLYPVLAFSDVLIG